MHFDKVIDGEDRERNPYRGCGRRSDFQKHHADDSDREHDLEIDRVASRNLYLAIKLLAEIHDRFGTVRGAGQILCFLLKLVCEVVDLRRRRRARLQAAVELVMPVHVVVQYDAAGKRVRRYVLDPPE